MNIIKNFVKWFLYIATGILIVTSVIFWIYDGDYLPKYTLWHILLSAFLTTFVTVIFSLDNCNSKKELWLRIIFHYLSLCAVMIVCGNWFGWMHLDFAGIFMMMGAVGAVYLISFVTHYILDLKQAEKINQRLKEKYGDE